MKVIVLDIMREEGEKGWVWARLPSCLDTSFAFMACPWKEILQDITAFGSSQTGSFFFLRFVRETWMWLPTSSRTHPSSSFLPSTFSPKRIPIPSTVLRNLRYESKKSDVSSYSYFAIYCFPLVGKNKASFYSLSAKQQMLTSRLCLEKVAPFLESGILIDFVAYILSDLQDMEHFSS
jgi:hypothetical protein